MRKLSLILCLLVFAPIIAFSQLSRGEKLDRIEAIVGDQIIMKSEIDGRLLLMSERNKTIKMDDKKSREKILNDLIDEKLIITKAQLDSITATPDEIDMQWQNFLQRSVMQYGSEKRLEQVWGMSIHKLKFELKEQIENQIISQKMLEQKFAGVSVTRREAEEFFAQKKDSLPEQPPTYEIYHIVKEIKADVDSRDAAIKLAKSVRDSIVRGLATFEAMAARYSQDGGTARDGGKLGWVDKGKLFPEFERAAFGLQTGETSLPVETPFGFHIIQTLEKRTNAVNARHILFKLQQSDDDTEKARQFLSNLTDSVRNGANFEELAKKYSDDKDSKGFGGLIGKVSENDMSPEMFQIIKDMKDGDVSEPISYSKDPNEPSLHIIYRKRKIPAHETNLDDDYELIEQYATMEKKARVYEEWLQELREEIYWEVKD